MLPSEDKKRKIEREFEMNRPQGPSIDEQLAMLEMNDEEAKKQQEEHIQTISKRLEEREDEDVFKKPKKEKQAVDKKVIIGMGVFTFVIIIGIIIIVLLNLQGGSDTSQTTATNTTEQITENSVGTGTLNEEEEINNRLSNPGEITTLSEGIDAFTNINTTLVSYLTDMRNLVIDYNNRDRNDIYIEDLMKDYKSAILADIDILAKYKPYYDQYGASDLYLVMIDRYQNAYELARTAKNVMTEKALTNNTNGYIEKEEELNIRATTAFVSFLESNEVEFSLEDNQITLH